MTDLVKRLSTLNFVDYLGEESIEEMMQIVKKQALAGNTQALYFCLKRVFPEVSKHTYTRLRYKKKLETQRDIDDAMAEVLARSMDVGSVNQISLEEADLLTDLLIKKKDTMDECLYGEVIELQKKVGLLE